MKKKGLIVLGGFALAMSLMQPLTSYADDVTEDVVESEEVSDSQVEGVMREGWQQDGNTWYYYENDAPIKDEMRVIDGYTYGFDCYGWMVINAGYNFPDGCGDVHWFDEDGHLRQNSWEITEFGTRYYYDEQGRLSEGLVEIDGYYYYFNEYNYAITNDYILDTDTLMFYYFNGEGKAVESTQFKEGWNSYASNWYYVKDGQLVKGDWVKYAGDWYFFDGSGQMFKNTTFDNYRFDEKGRMVTGWYKQYYGSGKDQYYEQYYYNPNGKAADGLTVIDGVSFLFVNGRIVEGSSVLGGEYYVISNGIVVSHTPVKDGWNSINGQKFYFSDGVMLKSQWLDIDGDKYYLTGDGHAYKSTQFARIDKHAYSFDDDGRMIAMLTGWQKSGDRWYYFDEDGNQITGEAPYGSVKIINGKKYYLSATGQLQQVSSILIDGVLYKSNLDGELVPVSSAKDGWINDSFYMRDGKIVTGWQKIDGSYYYFTEKGKQTSYVDYNGSMYYLDELGKMQTGWFISINGWRYADASGKIVEDGWKKINKIWYYFYGMSYVTGMRLIDGEWNLFNSDGKWVRAIKDKNKWISDSGYYYYVDEKGQILTNRMLDYKGKSYYFTYDGTMVTKQTCYVDDKIYYAGADGAIVKNKWIASDEYVGKWLYYGNDGARVLGWQKINQKWYYFDKNGMVTGDVVDGGKVYHFDTNGVWDGKSGKTTAGWYKLNGEYYYGGTALDIGRGWKKIGSEIYYFGYGANGALKRNCTVIGPNGKNCYVDSNGKVVKNAWCKTVDSFGTNWYYADKDGTLVYGLQTIGGKQYYFSPTMVTCDWLSNDLKTVYEISASGEVTKVITASGTKWIKTTNGNWYYSKNGQFVRGYEVIDGKAYYFDTNGMVTNCLVQEFGYFGANGELAARDGWVKKNGNWLYLKDGMAKIFGKTNMDTVIGAAGKYYLIDHKTGYAKTGVNCSAGICYYYNSDKGTRTVVSFKKGWNKYDGKWYYLATDYLHNDYLAGMLTMIDNKWYYFEGSMITDQYRYIDWNNMNELVYFGSDGAMVTNTWKKINGVWRYFDSNGYALKGEHVIDGVKYDFPTF